MKNWKIEKLNDWKIETFEKLMSSKSKKITIKTYEIKIKKEKVKCVRRWSSEIEKKVQRWF